MTAENIPETACSHHHPLNEDETFHSRSYSSSSSSSNSSSKLKGRKEKLSPTQHMTSHSLQKSAFTDNDLVLPQLDNLL